MELAGGGVALGDQSHQAPPSVAGQVDDLVDHHLPAAIHTVREATGAEEGCFALYGESGKELETFGETLCELAERDDRIHGITAAMPSGGVSATTSSRGTGCPCSAR